MSATTTETIKTATSTESPFSVNWRLTDPNGVECQLTMRAVSAETLEEALDVLDLRSKVVESMISEGWTNGTSSRGGAQTPADPSAPTCNCGIPRTKKTGQGKKGPWAGWMCKNRKCDPQWID